MRLEKLAQFAEVVSGVAVVVTLVFLILELRANTDELQATRYANLIESMNRLQTAQMTDPDSIRVWDAYFRDSASELDALDQMRLDLALLTHFRIYESAYVAERRGLMAVDEWNRFERALCQHYFRAQRNDVEALDVLSTSLTTSFMDYMSENCSE